MILVIFYKIISLQINNQVEKHRQYRVLMWTVWYKHKWVSILGEHKNCVYNNCVFSDNRTDLQQYDAIVFHWPNIKPKDTPQKLIDNQKWVLFDRETPYYIYSNLRSLGLKRIDWMMTYRTDSDIYTPYGRVFKCDTNWKQRHSFENKRKSIAWFVSNCKTPSKRETYVKKLQEYIDVDIYGYCGPFKCKKSNELCDDIIAEKYKFYLSFENSVSILNLRPC